MHDPLLDQRLEHCRQLLKCWQQFHLFLGECAKHERLFSAQEEAQFLKLKSQIAILYDSFFESLDNPNRETIAIAQSIITVVESCILLRQVQRMSTPERKKMELEWHEAYLLINATIGNLEEEQAKLARISPTKHRQEVILHKTVITVKAIVKDKRLHHGLMALAVIVALVVLPKMGVYDYSFLKGWDVTEKVYTGGKSLLRKTIMKNLPFDDWNEYAALYPPNVGPPGCSPKGNLQENIIALARPIVNLLLEETPATDESNILARRTQTFDVAGREAHMIYLMVAKTSYARTVAAQSGKLSSKGIPSNILERMYVASYANMVIIVAAENSSDMQNFRDYCVPPFQKKIK